MKDNMSSMIKTSAILGVLTVGSKVLGFLREIILASRLGASYIVDAYVLAYNIPNILLGGIFVALGTAYLPLLSQIYIRGGQKEANRFTSQTINIVIVFSSLLLLAGIIFAEELIPIFAPGFDAQTASLTVQYLRVTFSFILITSVMNIFDRYLNYNKVFFPQVITDYLQNICVIIAIIISSNGNFQWLIWGLFFGYLIKCICLIVFSAKKEFCYTLNTENIVETFRAIIPLAIPVFLATTMQEINSFVDRSMASTLPSGSVAALNYGNQLNMLVYTVGASVLTTVIYPSLSKANSANDKNVFSDILRNGFILILTITIPCTIGALVYNRQIVEVIYEHGKFDGSAAELTGNVYMCYSIGLIAISINDYLTRAYYALRDMKMPMIFSFAAIIINIILNIALVGRFQQSGLAIATSIAAICNSMMLILGFRKRHGEYSLIGSVKEVFQIVMFSLISILIPFAVFRFTGIDNRWLFIIIVVVSIVNYFIMLRYSRNSMIRSLLHPNKKRDV